MHILLCNRLEFLLHDMWVRPMVGPPVAVISVVKIIIAATQSQDLPGLDQQSPE